MNQPVSSSYRRPVDGSNGLFTLHGTGNGTGNGQWWVSILLYVLYTPHSDREPLLSPANEVWGKVIFLHLFVILFTGGGLPQCMLAYHTPTGTMHHHPPRDHAPPRTMHPSGAEHAGRYGQRAAGTHPTGMQSCFLLCPSQSLSLSRSRSRAVQYVWAITGQHQVNVL